MVFIEKHNNLRSATIRFDHLANKAFITQRGMFFYIRQNANNTFSLHRSNVRPMMHSRNGSVVKLVRL